jgi:hypothetical protein
MKMERDKDMKHGHTLVEEASNRDQTLESAMQLYKEQFLSVNTILLDSDTTNKLSQQEEATRELFIEVVILLNTRYLN